MSGREIPSASGLSMDHFSCEGFRQRLDEVLKQLNAGQISHRKAARELKIGYATLKRPWTGTKGRIVMQPVQNSPNNNEKVLTSIHGAYTLSTTQKAPVKVMTSW